MTSGKPSRSDLKTTPSELRAQGAAPAPPWVSSRNPFWRPAVDIYETETALVVRMEIAGMQEEDFSIQIEGQALLIRGVRSDVPERRAYYQAEIGFGEFNVLVELPLPVSVEGVTAEYHNGFMQVVLPKLQPRRIPVE